jgi:hypothetical protein
MFRIRGPTLKAFNAYKKLKELIFLLSTESIGGFSFFMFFNDEAARRLLGSGAGF